MAIQPQKEAADAIRITPLIMQQLVVVGGFVLLLVVGLVWMFGIKTPTCLENPSTQTAYKKDL